MRRRVDADCEEMLRRDWVTPSALQAAFDVIEPDLYRYPAVDPVRFRRALENAVWRA